MATTELVTRDTGKILESVVTGGDLKGFTAAERVTYYGQVCDSLGLNPLTQPFLFVSLNGKLVLYATKACTDQLRALRQVSVQIVSQAQVGDLYVVHTRATTPDGRSDEDLGVVPTAGLRGEALANSLLKAITKAKRRVTLSICGLGMLDETEIDSVPDAQRVVVASTGELLPTPAAPVRQTVNASATETAPIATRRLTEQRRPATPEQEPEQEPEPASKPTTPREWYVANRPWARKLHQIDAPEPTDEWNENDYLAHAKWLRGEIAAAKQRSDYAASN